MMGQTDHSSRAGIKTGLALNEERLHDPYPGYEPVHVYVKCVVYRDEEFAFHRIDLFERDSADGGP
jgi:hypothetical protein